MSFLRTRDEITADWLTEVLGEPVEAVDVVAVGTGQMSQSHRVTFTSGGKPRSVVVKLASEDAGSRSTGMGLGAYEREVRFYRELAPRLDGAPVAACRHVAFDDAEGWFTLVLEDIAPARQGDQIAGCDHAQARVAMEALADLHRPFLGDRELAQAEWVNAPSPLNQALLTQLLSGFFERYDGRVATGHRLLVEQFVRSADGWLAEQPRLEGLAHGDYRLDNMLWGEPGAPRPLTVVDWQTVSWSSPLTDVAYFLGISLEVAERRANEEELVRTYFDALDAEGLTWDDCWHEYRRMTFHAVLMSVAASMLVQRTERGDEMFMVSLARSAQQAIDLDSADLLPAAGAGRPEPLAPTPEDEGSHPPTAEELFNESWYFDAVDDGGELGAYVRIGLNPNLGVAWYTAYVCGRDRPVVAVVDTEAPLPRDDGRLAVKTDAIDAEHVCEEPLERFAVKLTATGRSHDDQAAPLRGEEGEPVELALDLVWETAGTPYQYRLATRYEIPCRVSGTIRVGDETVSLSGTGQRDHSWGARDWWSMDWVWSAGELDDGTRLHAVQLRIPERPELGVGYVQSGGELTELERVDAEETMAADGLIERARLGLSRSELEVDLEPIAFGPLRLEAPDGRLSLFPRAMCRFIAADGRTGLGWAEWNLNQR